MLMFGLPFLNPLPHEFFGRPAYRSLGLFLGERGSGVICVAVALWRMSGLFWASYCNRVYATVVSIFIWCFLFLMFVMSEPSNPGTFLFGTWTLLECWTLFRIRRRLCTNGSPIR